MNKGNSLIKSSYLLLFIVSIIFLSCSSQSSNASSDSSKHYIFFDKLSNINVDIYINGNKVKTIISDSFHEQNGSSFEFFVDEKVENNSIYKFVFSHNKIESQILFIEAKNIKNKTLYFSTLTLAQANYNNGGNKNYLSSYFLVDSIDKTENSFLFINPTKKINFKHSNFINSWKKNDLTNRILKGEKFIDFIKEDRDNDGLTLLDELVQASYDFERDSDNDGLSDKEEKLLGTILYQRDSDNDGLSDIEELNSTYTSPLLADSDGDYLSDKVEIELKTNPNESDENSDGILDGIDEDPLFSLQWYLKSEGSVVSNINDIQTIKNNNLDILLANSKTSTFLSKPKIQVIDTGVQAIHEDLEVDLTLSSNEVNNTNDPTPTKKVSTIDRNSPLDIGHGTAVAGILAGSVENNLGVRGVVPGGIIVGSNWLESGEMEKLESLWLTSNTAKNVAISNNSWGGYYINDDLFEQIMELATSNLREKKGRIFVVAGGNEREEYGNSNLSTLSNNPYVFTVTALNHENKYASYASPGANILISAYGGEKYFNAPTIATTLLMGESYYANELAGVKGAVTSDLDKNRNYTFAMNGTSAATPMVSGALALVLDSCPNLTWRDLKYLVVITAKKIDENSSSWIKNKAGYWHSNNYGFGLIQANKMIDECKSGFYEPLGEFLTLTSGKKNFDRFIPDGDGEISFFLEISNNLKIEWVGLDVKSDHPFSGDLSIDLISPSGTKSEIITSNDVKFDAYSDGFKFGSLSFFEENSKGTWKVIVKDKHPEDSGILNSLELIVKGHK